MYKALIKQFAAKDEFTDTPVIVDGTMLAEVKETIANENRENAKRELRFLLEVTASLKDRAVREIRNERMKIAMNKDFLNKLDAATAYGAEKDDWRPLLQVTGNAFFNPEELPEQFRN